MLSGTFPPDIREKFRNLLEYFGQSPIIVRSSSFLEDGFGNAFAGKYESVFCVNQGSPEERLEAFEAAVRTVYASTMDISALEYRKQRGLQHSDEQMAVPMQNSVADRHRFSQRIMDRFFQRIMDVLDTEKNELTETEIYSMLENLPLWYKKAVMERDYEAEAVGAINTYYKGKKKHILLMTPGRVGTSSPELGVPVSFAQISGFCGICEVSDNRAGYMPELSYGSHMFQDLVEAGIFYCALWGDERTVKYNETFFGDLENLFPVICPERKELAEIFRVSEPEDLWYWNNEQTGETVCGILHERIG